MAPSPQLIFTILVAGLGAVAVGAGPAPSAHAGYGDGAPPGFTGGFGEPACDACHFSADLNESPGKLTIAGLPDRYIAGETYALEIVLARPAMVVAGFQIAVRFAEDGTQAGTLRPLAAEVDRIVVATDRGVEYANQTLVGSESVEADTARWRILWRAPTAGGSVRLHAAANAANGDGSATGDYVYTAEAESAP